MLWLLLIEMKREMGEGRGGQSAGSGAGGALYTGAVPVMAQDQPPSKSPTHPSTRSSSVFCWRVLLLVVVSSKRVGLPFCALDLNGDSGRCLVAFSALPHHHHHHHNCPFLISHCNGHLPSCAKVCSDSWSMIEGGRVRQFTFKRHY